MDRALWWAFLQGEPQDVWFPEKRSKRQQKRMARQQGHEWDRDNRGPPFKKARLDHYLSTDASANLDSEPSVVLATIHATGMTEWNNGGTEETIAPINIVFNEEGEELETVATLQESEASMQTSMSDSKFLTPREVNPSLLSQLNEVSGFSYLHE
jgi:hypothetical protein